MATAGKFGSELAKRPLWLPREMIARGKAGAERLTDVIPDEAYDDATIYILFHGNANAAYAVMDRIRRYEIAFSPALRRAIERWDGFNRESFYDLVGEERRTTTHHGNLPTLTFFPMEIENDRGELETRLSHYFRQQRLGAATFPVFFGAWMMDVWTWWVGRINQLHRMYQDELSRTGEER